MTTFCITKTTRYAGGYLFFTLLVFLNFLNHSEKTGLGSNFRFLYNLLKIIMILRRIGNKKVKNSYIL